MTGEWSVPGVVSGVLLVLGSFLAMLAGLGVLRFPDTLSRLQAATKLQAAGLGILLTGSAVVAEDAAELAVMVLIIVAVVVTVPVLSQVVGRATFRDEQRERADREPDDPA